MFFTAFKKIYSGFGFSLRTFRMACSLGMRSFVLDLDDFCFSFEFWAVPSECLVVFSAVAASEFDTGALIFIMSFAAAPRTCRYCFTAFLHCVLISKTSLAAH